jgi:hypothetical protein
MSDIGFNYNFLFVQGQGFRGDEMVNEESQKIKRNLAYLKKKDCLARQRQKQIFKFVVIYILLTLHGKLPYVMSPMGHFVIQMS